VDEQVGPSLTIVQAYEAAYRFVWQYYGREPQSESLALMLVSMQPIDDYAKTDDPANWQDWQRCVDETLNGAPIPAFPPVDRSTHPGTQGNPD
jgi:hypothetical protein